MKKYSIRIMCVLILMFTLALFPVKAYATYSQYYDIILKSNKTARSATVDPLLYLEMNDDDLRNLSNQIVAGIVKDYEKVKAIHDWVCGNIYYDYDGFGFVTIEVGSDEEAVAIDNMSAYELLMTYKRGKCSYYSSIFSSLVRAQGIPCMTVSGYAEGAAVSSPSFGGYLVNYTEQKIYVSGDKWTDYNYNLGSNHDWNEVYVDGRWIIVDTTWDSGNQYRDGNYISASVRQSYFDISEELFAKDHRIIEYGKGASRTPIPQQIFKDVNPSDYFYPAVQWAIENNITNGTDINTFAPEGNCTHSQILTFLWRAAGSPQVDVTTPFEMSGSEYYYDAVKWAYKNGMIGADFSHKASCTRSAAVKYIWQAFGSPSVSANNRFTDVASNAHYAQAVTWAVNKGITTGASSNTFNPDGICNRGQIVTFLYRAYTK